MSAPHSELAETMDAFLADLAQANRSAHTCRAYVIDLKQFATWYGGSLATITPAILRAYFGDMVHLQPAIWARKQASLASFMAWAYAQELVESNPMGRVERMKPGPPALRGVGWTLVEAILAVGAAGATLTSDNTASSLFRFSIPVLVTAQLRQTQSGKAVCNFVIAVNRFDGSTKKVEVSAWNALAAPAHDHLRKGRECSTTASSSPATTLTARATSSIRSN